MLRRTGINLNFYPTKLSDPPHARELVVSLYRSLLLRSPSLQVRSNGLLIAAQVYYCCIMEGLVSSTGEGAAPYRRLCSVLHSRRGRFCTIHCARFNVEDRLSTVPCVRLYIYNGGGGLFTGPCVRLYITGSTRLSAVPCVRLYITGWDRSLPSRLFGFM